MTNANTAIGAADDSLLLCASDLQHSAIYDNHVEMQACIRAVANRIAALASAAEQPGADERRLRRILCARYEFLPYMDDGEAQGQKLDWLRCTVDQIEARILEVDHERFLASAAAPAEQPSEIENLRKALQFYANGEHFMKADEHAWDTVSGEPQNYWCDEAGTATVEDGTIARLALAGHQIKFDADDAPQPSPTPQADSQPAPVVGTVAHVGTGKTTLTGAIASALRAALLVECDSPELCAVSRSCAGQFGTKRICASRGQAPAGAAVEMHKAKCPALIGDACSCERSDPAVDKAWAQFCAGIGDGPDAPYPGMIVAFERYYGQSFADKDWRDEAAVWAAAWKARDAQPTPTPQQDAGVLEDAARYRWLREQSFDTWKLIAWNTWNNDPAVWPDRDAAIDAARKQGANHD